MRVFWEKSLGIFVYKRCIFIINFLLILKFFVIRKGSFFNIMIFKVKSIINKVLRIKFIVSIVILNKFVNLIYFIYL